MKQEGMMPSPEELAQIKKSRMISDGELLSGGAELRDDGNIVPSPEQIIQIKKEEELRPLLEELDNVNARKKELEEKIEEIKKKHVIEGGQWNIREEWEKVKGSLEQ